MPLEILWAHSKRIPVVLGISSLTLEVRNKLAQTIIRSNYSWLFKPDNGHLAALNLPSVMKCITSSAIAPPSLHVKQNIDDLPVNLPSVMKRFTPSAIARYAKYRQSSPRSLQSLSSKCTDRYSKTRCLSCKHGYEPHLAALFKDCINPLISPLINYSGPVVEVMNGRNLIALDDSDMVVSYPPKCGVWFRPLYGRLLGK